MVQVYAPRRPQSQALYQAVAQNFDLFRTVYDDRLLPRYGILRQVARTTFEKFLTLTLTKLNIALEEAPPRGPPSWYLAIQASQWIAQHQDFYPPEEDLPQHGPSPDDYQIDPTFPD